MKINLPKLKWIMLFVLILIFATISIFVVKNKDIYIDKYVYNFISKFISVKLTNIIKLLTHLGSAKVVIPISIIPLYLFKDSKYGKLMILNLVLITIINIVFKNIFGRPRPEDIFLIKESGYSFPSGHSLTSMAVYGFIIYLISKSNLDKIKKIIINISLILIILVVGLSRIYLGVHFATDVIGGFSLSLIYLIIFTNIIEKKNVLEKI